MHAHCYLNQLETLCVATVPFSDVVARTAHLVVHTTHQLNGRLHAPCTEDTQCSDTEHTFLVQLLQSF